MRLEREGTTEFARGEGEWIFGEWVPAQRGGKAMPMHYAVALEAEGLNWQRFLVEHKTLEDTLVFVLQDEASSKLSLEKLTTLGVERIIRRIKDENSGITIKALALRMEPQDQSGASCTGYFTAAGATQIEFIGRPHIRKSAEQKKVDKAFAQ